MLISIHMPKTGGLSFRAALEESFGSGFRHDYGDYPLAHPPLERHRRALEAGDKARAADFDQIECIHGHFLPSKYLPLAEVIDCQFVTWMREPVARLISHYHYWQRAYDADSELTSSLHRRVVEEAWSLEQFCLSPELRNVYGQFLWEFPLQRLDFIGITEFYEEDLRYFSTKFLCHNAEPRWLNSRRSRPASSSVSELSPSLAIEVREYHAEDVALYEQALQARVVRMEGERKVCSAPN